ncbi:MAG: nucleotidyltransferase family protein, partial [Planctomycetota bacterium]
MMHLLERIAKAFNEAGVPLMALKGAALNLTLYRHPQDRPMVDLDLLVKPADSDRARAILEDVGCLRSDIVFREDFFPRYYYEIEYTAGSVDPVLIDLHVRP